MKQRLTANDWDDVADLLDQGAKQAEDSDTHTKAAREKAAEWMIALAMKAQAKSLLLTKPKSAAAIKEVGK